MQFWKIYRAHENDIGAKSNSHKVNRPNLTHLYYLTHWTERAGSDQSIWQLYMEQCVFSLPYKKNPTYIGFQTSNP